MHIISYSVKKKKKARESRNVHRRPPLAPLASALHLGLIHIHAPTGEAVEFLFFFLFFFPAEVIWRSVMGRHRSNTEGDGAERGVVALGIRHFSPENTAQ